MKKTHIIPENINKRLISTLMSTYKGNQSECKDFTLKSSSEFASRSGDVFGKLQSLEKMHETWISKNDTLESFENSDTHSDSKSQNNSDSKTPTKLKSVIAFRDPDSVKNKSSDAVFKKPFPPKTFKRNSYSSFQKKRKKWTKYSLEDVPISSDATNAAAAFQFLNELKARKEQKEDIEDNKDGKIVFKKPKQNDHSATSGMKEKAPPSMKSRSRKTCYEENKVSNEVKASGNVLLAHLQENED